MHDCGNNLINIKSNGIVYTIAITKHLDSNTKCLEVLLCYDFINEITNEEKDVLLEAEPNLFMIGIIILPKLEVLTTMFDAKIDTNTKISTNVKIDADAKISIDAKIGCDAKIDIDAKIGSDVEINAELDPSIANATNQLLKKYKKNLCGCRRI